MCLLGLWIQHLMGIFEEEIHIDQNDIVETKSWENEDVVCVFSAYLDGYEMVFVAYKFISWEMLAVTSPHIFWHTDLFTEEGTENKLEILPKLSVMIFDNQECSYFFARLSSCWTWSAERELCRTDS